MDARIYSSHLSALPAFGSELYCVFSFQPCFVTLILISRFFPSFATLKIAALHFGQVLRKTFPSVYPVTLCPQFGQYICISFIFSPFAYFYRQTFVCFYIILLSRSSVKRLEKYSKFFVLRPEKVSGSLGSVKAENCRRKSERRTVPGRQLSFMNR